MYSFEPSEEQKMLVDAVKRFAVEDLRKAYRDADEDCFLPPELIEKGWELGYLQASVPETYDGFGERSALTGVLAAEEMAYGDLSAALAIMTPGLFTTPLLIAGTHSQKEELISPVIEMEWKPYTAALMEQTINFDPNDLVTEAVEIDGEYILTGTKSYVPFAQEAEAMIIYANLEGATQGFIIKKGAEGLKIGGRQELLGLHALPLYTVELDKVKAMADERLGGADGHEFGEILASTRVALAAMAVGVSRAAYEYSLEYAKDRDVFGAKVAQKQAIAFMLAEMATEIEAIRLIVWEAAWMVDNQHTDAKKQAYLAITGAADLAMMVTDRAVQILGGHGYIREHPVELWMRNGRGFSTFAGLAIV